MRPTNRINHRRSFYENYHFSWSGGSRLFPLSRESYPKQFLKLEDEKSLLVHTVERFLDFVVPEDILVVTNQRYLYHVQNELAECQAEGAHIILEPVARNTAPAIFPGASQASRRRTCSSTR